MAVMTDTFTAANGTQLTSHTSDSGHTWSVPTGGTPWTISDGEAYAGVSFTTRCISSFVPQTPDYSISADFKRLTDVSGINAGLFLRGDGGSSLHGYFFRYIRSTSLWRVDRITSGSTSVRGSASASDVVDGTSYRMELTVDGSTLTAKVNDTVVWTGTDTNLTDVGVAGITSGGGVSSATTGIHLDNVTIADKTVPQPYQSATYKDGQWVLSTVPVRVFV